jgi:hypothetical protein
MFFVIDIDIVSPSGSVGVSPIIVCNSTNIRPRLFILKKKTSLKYG